MPESGAAARCVSIAKGVYRFDTHYLRAGHTACYIVVDDGQAAIIDTGVSANVPDLIDALKPLSIRPEQIRWVIPTHVHLDHAGGAGQLMQALPDARLGIHPSGAQHMIDPSKLEAGVRSLYGDDFFEREYGSLIPIAAERVDALDDQTVLELGSRKLRILHTPGHAWHHFSVLDTTANVLIAGDAFGASYPGYVRDDVAFAVPVVPPPQFNPQAYCATLERIKACTPECVAPAHFPLIHAVDTVADMLKAMLEAGMEEARVASSVDDLQARLARTWAAWLPANIAQSQYRKDFALDLWLSAEGLWAWQAKQ